MNMRRIVGAILALLASSSIVRSDIDHLPWMSGAELLGLCKSDRPRCAAYIKAVAELASDPTSALHPQELCLPRATPTDDEIHAFKLMVKGDPSLFDWAAVDVVVKALRDTYPCRRASSG